MDATPQYPSLRSPFFPFHLGTSLPITQQHQNTVRGYPHVTGTAGSVITKREWNGLVFILPRVGVTTDGVFD
jgi:hypothetical protein